jgi:hypothetical protein
MRYYTARVIHDYCGPSHTIVHVRFAPENGQAEDHAGKSTLCHNRM